MKKVIFSFFACLAMTIGASAKEIDNGFIEDLNISNEAVGKCTYAIFVMDREGNFTGKFEIDSTTTATALDCLSYVNRILESYLAIDPTFTFDVYNDFDPTK